MENVRSTADIQAANLRKYKVVVWDSEGMSKKEICRRLDTDKNFVKRILDKFEQYGGVEKDLRTENPGRPPILDQGAKDIIRDIVTSNQAMPLKGIKEEVREVMDIEPSISTLHRTIQEMFKHVLPTWTPLLENRHKAARLEYCRHHIEAKTDFRNVMFTDECRFYLNRNTRKVYVLRGDAKPHKIKWNPDESILVWGCVCYRGQVYLEVVEGTLKHGGYLQILERFLEQGVSQLYVYRSWEFLQDLAPPHRAVRVREYLEENKVKVHFHPANSPDLNPIEFIWGIMKNKVEGRKPTNKRELEDAIFWAWNDLTVEQIRGCIDYLKDYLFEVVRVKGDFPKKLVGK